MREFCNKADAANSFTIAVNMDRPRNRWQECWPISSKDCKSRGFSLGQNEDKMAMVDSLVTAAAWTDTHINPEGQGAIYDKTARYRNGRVSPVGSKSVRLRPLPLLI